VRAVLKTTCRYIKKTTSVIVLRVSKNRSIIVLEMRLHEIGEEMIEEMIIGSFLLKKKQSMTVPT